MKQHILRWILFSSLIMGTFGCIYWYTNTYYNGLKAPDEPFPTIPVYPQHLGNVRREETTTLVTDTFITTDTNDVVYQWYFQELPKQGWQPQQPYDNSYEYSLLRYEQGFRPVGVYCHFEMRRGAGTRKHNRSSRVSSTGSSPR